MYKPSMWRRTSIKFKVFVVGMCELVFIFLQCQSAVPEAEDGDKTVWRGATAVDCRRVLHLLQQVPTRSCSWGRCRTKPVSYAEWLTELPNCKPALTQVKRKASWRFVYSAARFFGCVNFFHRPKKLHFSLLFVDCTINIRQKYCVWVPRLIPLCYHSNLKRFYLMKWRRIRLTFLIRYRSLFVCCRNVTTGTWMNEW